MRAALFGGRREIRLGRPDPTALSCCPTIEERIQPPGRVCVLETDLDRVVGAYEAMDQRRAIKSLVRVDRQVGELPASRRCPRP